MAILGAHSYIDDSIELLFQEDADFIIGKFCSIAKGCRIILGGNHRGDWISTYPFPAMFHASPNIPGHRATKGPVIIGNDVWIGAGVTIVSGVTVGDGAIIGAGSVIVKDVEPYSVVCGNPGQRKKYRFPKRETERLLTLKWWNWTEDKIREAIPILMSNDMQKLFKFTEEHE